LRIRDWRFDRVAARGTRSSCGAKSGHTVAALHLRRHAIRVAVNAKRAAAGLAQPRLTRLTRDSRVCRSESFAAGAGRDEVTLATVQK
jgi:hypothetical protein